MMIDKNDDIDADDIDIDVADADVISSELTDDINKMTRDNDEMIRYIDKCRRECVNDIDDDIAAANIDIQRLMNMM